MRRNLVLALFTVSLIALIGLPNAHASTWYPGEGLKQGDYYSYNVCWTDWHNCTPLEIDFWVKNQTSDGSGWNLEFLAIDGSITQKGIVTIGNVTPDPTYSDPNISDYSNVYKNTISWLDSFSTRDSPKDFSYPAWGRTGSVGGQSVGPTGQDKVTVTAGTFNTWKIGWHKGVDNTIWVAPNLAFPVKAIVYVDIASGSTPPPDYTLELLKTGNSQTEPEIMKKTSIGGNGPNPLCPQPNLQSDSVHAVTTTDSGSMIVESLYSPSNPHNGCPIEWRLSFEKNFDQTQKNSNVHYDIFTVDDQGVKIASAAQDLGRADLFAPVGDDDRTITLKGTTPTTHFVIAVLGTGSEASLSDTSLSGVVSIDVKTAEPLSVPEFPLGSLMVMALVIFLGIIFARFKPSLSNIKL